VHVPWLGFADTSASPAGSGSVTMTAGSSLGPLLRTTSVYITCPPDATEAADVALVIATFERPLIGVQIVELLVLVSGSNVAPAVVAVLRRQRSSELATRPVIETVCDAPGARSPTAHVTVPVASLQPGLAETNVTSSGRSSVIVWATAVLGPLLVTFSENVTSSPGTTGDGDALFSSTTSAAAELVTLQVYVVAPTANVQLPTLPPVGTAFPAASVHAIDFTYSPNGVGEPAAIASVIVYVCPWLAGKFVVDAVVADPDVVADVDALPSGLRRPTVK
jgi:hypothetical protein